MPSVLVRVRVYKTTKKKTNDNYTSMNNLLHLILT